MRNIFLTLAVTGLLFGAGEASAVTFSGNTKGFTGDIVIEGLMYRMDTEGGVYVSGMKEASADMVVPASITHNGIEYPVTAIGPKAFSVPGLRSIPQSITLPETVTTIGEEAFREVANLSEINLEYVTEIGPKAFAFCISLTDLKMPKLEGLHQQAFMCCRGLTSVTMGSAGQRLTLKFNPHDVYHNPYFDYYEYDEQYSGDFIGTFLDCTSLRDVSILSPTYLYDGDFDGPVFSDVTNGRYQFTQHGVEPLHDRMSRLPFGAAGMFKACNAIETIEMPAVQKLDSLTFETLDNLRTLHLPRTVGRVFMFNHFIESCPNLTDIYCYQSFPPYIQEEECDTPLGDVDPAVCRLHVPKGCAPVYARYPYWSDFAEVIEMDDFEPVLSPDMVPEYKASNYAHGINASVNADGESVTLSYTMTDYVKPDGDNEGFFYAIPLLYWQTIAFDKPAVIDGREYTSMHLADDFGNLPFKTGRVTLYPSEYITSVGDRVLAGRTVSGSEFSEFKFGDNVRTYGADVLRGATLGHHRDLNLGSCVTGIGSGAFDCVNTPEWIWCHAPVPPLCADDSPFGNKGSLTLIVPEDAVDSYSSAICWRMFDVVHTIESLGIHAPVAENRPSSFSISNGVLTINGGSAMPVTITGMDGSTVWQGTVSGSINIDLTRGMYIITVGDKSVKYVI